MNRGRRVHFRTKKLVNYKGVSRRGRFIIFAKNSRGARKFKFLSPPFFKGSSLNFHLQKLKIPTRILIFFFAFRSKC